jgi:hypothetical protein
MKPKFQPSRAGLRALQKWATDSPESPTRAASAISTRPVAVTASLPKRSIRRPVKKLGPNMASTCHWIPSAAAPTEWPQPTMASGAAVMTKLISPYETRPAITATMKRG